MTDLTADEAEEFTGALGQVAAGAYRQIALGQRLGVPAALGLSTNEWVEQRLGGYVRMSMPARREAVAELTAEGMSKPEIAEVLGVATDTVARDRRAVLGNTTEPEDVPEPGAETTAPVLSNTEPVPPAEFSDAEPPPTPVAELTEADPGFQAKAYLAAFMKALVRSDDFMQFDPARLAEVGDLELARTLDGYLTRVGNFVHDFRQAQPGLRAVKG